LAVMFVTWGLCFLARMSPNFLSPYLVKGIGMNTSKLGMLAAIAGITWAASSLFFGALSDRVGRKVILVPSIFAFSLLTLFCGMVHTYGQLAVLRALFGIAGGPCFTMIMAMVNESSAADRRGRNVGIVVTATSVVALGVGPVLLTQVASHWNWRLAFASVGLPGILMGFIVWAFIPEPQRRMQAKAKTGLKDYVSILRYRNVWLACMGAIGLITCITNINTFCPLYMTQVAMQKPTTAGFLLSAHGIGGLFYGLLAPAWSDRVGRKKAAMLVAAFSFIYPLLFLYQPAYHHLWLLGGAICITSMQMALGSLTMVLVPSESVPPALAGTAIGLASMFADIFGATVAPMASGWIAENHGQGAPLVLAAAGMVLVFFATASLKKNPEFKAQTAAVCE